MENRVPTTIVTGFLGSGKTTIIGHLIDHLQSQGQQIIYIKNEIGDQDIDSQVLKAKHIVARELLNGCICCTLVGPFVAAINEVVETYHPDRIIIEASGAADPAALALMISGHPLLTRDAVLSVIDVLNFEGYTELTTTARQQTNFTDIIVFNKVELADLDRKQAVVGYVRELNTHSPIVEAPHGEVNPELVFGGTTQELADLLSTAADDGAEHGANHNQHHHIEDDQLQSFRCQLDHVVDAESLTAWLETLPARIFRVKGFVTKADGSIWLLNRVGNRTTLEKSPVDRVLAPVVLVFIGHQAQECESDITQQLQSL